MKNASENSVMSGEEKYSKGVQLCGEGRFDEALTTLEDAIRESQDARPEFWNDWGFAALACGHADKAEEGFKHALTLNPQDVQAAANLGVLLAGQDRAAEAVPFLEKAAANVGEEQRATMTQLLAECRTKMASEVLSQSQTAFRDLVSGLQPASSAEAVVKSPSEYWYPDITGWFSRMDALHLCTAIKLTRPRRILEIGTFYGRSTASICAVIKSMNRPVKFITIDLDFRTEEQFRKTFSEIHGLNEIAMPLEYNEAFKSGLSTTAYAKYQLVKHGLAKFVQIESGDFRGVDGTFDLVFADVMHERNEIQNNLAAILAKINNDGILAVHDLSDENKHLIDSSSNEIEFISRCETLGIYRVRGTS
jgi:predicted O-methyltransferase YrrM